MLAGNVDISPCFLMFRLFSPSAVACFWEANFSCEDKARCQPLLRVATRQGYKWEKRGIDFVREESGLDPLAPGSFCFLTRQGDGCRVAPR